MRLVIFLLAVANLLFFAWTRGVFGEGAQGNPRAGEPLRAEQIRLLSNDRPPQESAEKEKEKPPPEPAKAATDTPVENDRCVVLNDVPQAEADALERRFAEARKRQRGCPLASEPPPLAAAWAHQPKRQRRPTPEQELALALPPSPGYRSCGPRWRGAR